LWRVTDRRSQCLEVFRSNSAAQTKDLRRSTRDLVDPERHLPMLMLDPCKLGASGDPRESPASLLVRAVRSAIGVGRRHSVGNCGAAGFAGRPVSRSSEINGFCGRSSKVGHVHGLPDAALELSLEALPVGNLRLPVTDRLSPHRQCAESPEAPRLGDRRQQARLWIAARRKMAHELFRRGLDHRSLPDREIVRSFIAIPHFPSRWTRRPRSATSAATRAVHPV